MTVVREVSIFQNGRNQALRIPREFELPGKSALMYQDGPRLVIEPKPEESFAELFAQWDNSDESMPEIEDEPMPLDEEIF